jgi:hypothetical protein
MNLFTLFRSNRTLVFGIVATLALLVSAAMAFDFRLAGMLGFLWQCLLLIVAMILTAACAVALLLAARALWRRR